MRSLIRRLWPMYHDIVPTWRPRHRGRPALVARRPVEHQGATVDWDPRAELDSVQDSEPEELLAEAAEREAEERVRHLAELDAAAGESVTAEWSAVLDPVLGPLFAAVEKACRVVFDEVGLTADEGDRLLAKYQAAVMQTGEYPAVRELVAA